MDPISITASALAFATAVKDLVELGQKIHESFAKVSKNRHNAQRTAEKIKDMVEEIRAFCEENKDSLANMKEFTDALEALLKKLRGFETSILPLVLQKGGVWKSAAFLRGWWRNNKIEARILELERDIVDVMRRHMMKSAMRTEFKQEVHYQETTRRLEDLSSGLTVVRRGVFSLQPPTAASPIASSSHIVSTEVELNIPMFARSTTSTSAPLLRGPDTITEDVMMTMFIKSELTYVATLVEKISTWHISGPRRIKHFCIVSDNADLTLDIFHLRRKVVRLVMDTRDILSDSGRLLAISVHDAERRVSVLSSRLFALGLAHEAIRVRDWATTLARSLANVSRNGHDRARLAFNLHMQSSAHRRDKTHSLQLIGEALSITRELLSQNGANAEFQGLHASSLLAYSQLAPDDHTAIRLCIEAIRLLLGILGISGVDPVESPNTIGLILHNLYSGEDFVDRVFSASPRPEMIARCADALEIVVTPVFNTGQCHNARNGAILCLALRRRMVIIHGQEYRLPLANSLSFFCSSKLGNSFPELQLLSMTEECIALWRELTQKNPVHYSRSLLNMLKNRAVILRDLGRYADAVATSQEAVNLAGRIGQDSALESDTLFQLAVTLYKAERHLDAVSAVSRIPATLSIRSRAGLYADISRGLLQTWRYKESAEAAHLAVALYRGMGVRSPNSRWTGQLAHALSLLATSLIALGSHPKGFIALTESVSIAENVLDIALKDLPRNLGDYLLTFKTYAIVSSLTNNFPRRADADYSPIQQLERLATLHPQNALIVDHLSSAQIFHAYSLYCAGRLEETLKYIDQWHGTWGPKTKFARAVAGMTWIKAKTLDAQGNAAEALLEIQSLHATAQLSISDYFMLQATVYAVQLEVAHGKCEKGMEISKQVLQLSRLGSQVSGFSRRLGWSLVGVAYAALHCRDYWRTMEAAREGIYMSDDSAWQTMGEPYDISIRPSLFAIMSSAVANTGNLGRAMNYAQQSVTLSLDIAKRKHDISATAAEYSLMETRGYLAEVLLAMGDLIQAQQICDERRIYFTERVKDRMGEYRDLAPILRMLGVLCCHEGRHDKGEAAARELTEMIDRLGLVFPSLQKQVKIRLRYQASVPILKVLDEMTKKLECEHQKGITALFKD